MSVNTHDMPSQERKPRRFRALGFSLVSLSVSLAVSGIMLAGGWMSYCSLLRQWKIGNAERQMDQYAAAAMQELTNDLTWSWAGVELSGAPYSRWKFMYDDLFQENGTMAQSRFGRLRDAEKFVTFSSHPTMGILIRGQVPAWAGDRWHPQYLFRGNSPHRNATNAFDRRDQMSVERFELDWDDMGQWTGSLQDLARRQALVKVHLIMHYAYRGNSDLGLYGSYYVREREYNTKILVKNWDVEGNAFRDSLVRHAG